MTKPVRLAREARDELYEAARRYGEVRPDLRLDSARETNGSGSLELDLQVQELPRSRALRAALQCRPPAFGANRHFGVDRTLPYSSPRPGTSS